YHKKKRANTRKKYSKTNLNTLVLIDEAHRLAPKENRQMKEWRE
ncbi:hypothetical protein TheetDRAFT_3010, partial [Thermoanaerobacter ethanolicus JW 200]